MSALVLSESMQHIQNAAGANQMTRYDVVVRWCQCHCGECGNVVLTSSLWREKEDTVTQYPDHRFRNISTNQTVWTGYCSQIPKPSWCNVQSWESSCHKGSLNYWNTIKFYIFCLYLFQSVPFLVMTIKMSCWLSCFAEGAIEEDSTYSGSHVIYAILVKLSVTSSEAHDTGLCESIWILNHH